jgi:hypothetical protein
MSDVEYHLTPEGKKARQVKAGDFFRMPHPRTGEEAILRALRVDGDTVSLVDPADGSGGVRRYQALACDLEKCWVAQEDQETA